MFISRISGGRLRTLVDFFVRNMASSSTSNTNRNKPFTVLVEGNIGSGKTTFLKHFEKFQNVELLTEPVEQWRNLHGHNLLDLLYKNPDRFAMPFQDYVTLTMLKNHIKETEKPIKLMERSMFSARYCFVEKMLSSGTIHPGMYHILQEWYDFLHKHHEIRCDLIVYLRTDPLKAHERVKLRARDEESCVPLEYLIDLHNLHEQWLIHGAFKRPAPVYVVDANLGLDKIMEEYQKSEDKIFQPMQGIYIENTNLGVTVSPSKRSDRERMY